MNIIPLNFKKQTETITSFLMMPVGLQEVL